MAYWKKSLNILLNLYGKNNPKIAPSYNELGTIWAQNGNLIKAEKFYNESLNILLRYYGENHSDTAESYNNLGILYKNLGEFEKSREFINKSCLW